MLYVGMTNNLERRMAEHKGKRVPGFTARYNVDLLMWYDSFPNVWDAIAFEKKVKGRSRAKKEELIRSKNPMWKDLSEGWLGLPEKKAAANASGPAVQAALAPTRDPSPSALDDRGDQLG